MEAENPEMFQRFTHSRLRFAEKQEAIAASQPQKTTVLRATAKPFEPSRPLIDTTTFANAANINSKDTKNNNVVLSNKENTKNSVPMDTTKSDKINSKVQINNKSNTIAMISQTVHMPKTKARSDTMTSESSRNSGNNTGKWTEAPKISKEFPNIPHSFRNSEDKRNNSRSSTVGGGLDYTNPNTNNIGIYHVADKKVIEVDEDTQAQVARETEQVWAAVEGWVEAEAVAEEKAWQKFLGTYKNDKRNKYTANNKRNRNFHYSIDYRGNRGLSKDSLTEDAEVADQLLADVLKTSLPLSPTSEQKTDLLIDTSPIVSKDPFSLSEMEFTCDSIASSFITDVSRSGQKTEYDWSSLAEGSRATGLHSLEQDSYNYMRSSLSKGVYSSHNSPTTRRHTYNDSVATSSTSNAYSPVSHAAGILSVSSCSYSSPPFGTRSLHDKLSSPDRKRALSPNAALKIIEARQTAAENNRENYVAEKIQKAMIASTRVKLRVEKEAIRIAKAEQALAWKLKEAEARHNEYIKMIKGKAGNENAKVDEITFINTLNSESIAEQFQKKLEDVEARILAAGERRKQRLLGISVQQRKKNTKKAQQMSELRLAHEQQKMERWEKLQKRLKSVQERREARLAELSRRFDEETRGRSSSNALNKSADSEDLLPPSHDNSKTVSSKVVKRIHDGGIAAVSLSDSNSEIAGVKNSAETLRDVASTEAALSELQSKLKTKKSKKKKNKSKEISTEFLNVLDAIDTVGELNRNELEARMIANESKYSSTVRISNNTNFDSTSVRYPVISEAVVDAEFQKLHNMIKRKTVVNALNDISQALDSTGASVPSRVNATGDSNVKIIASLICKMTSVSTICSTIRAFTAAALSAARDYNDLQECDQLISELSSQMKIEDISNDISSDKMNAYKLIWTQLPEVLDSFSFDSVDQVDDSTAEDLVVLIRICFGYEIGLMSAPTMAFLAINNKTYLDYVEKLLNYILLIQKKFNEKLIVAGLPIVLVDLFSLLLSIYNTTIRNDRDNYHDKIVYSFSLEKTFGGLLQAVAKIIGTFVTELSTTSTIKSSKENDNEAEISTRINSNYIDNFIWYLFCMDHFNTVTETIFIQSQLLESLNHQYNTKNVEEADAFNNPTVDYLVDYRISIFSTISYTTSALLGFTNSIAYYIR